MRIKKTVWLLALLAGSMVAAPSVNPLKGQTTETEKEFMQQVNRLGQALYYIREFYLDTLNTSAMIDGLLSTITEQLDPHSAYITASEAEEMNQPLEGNFEGIGIEFAILRDSLVVVTPVAGGPSESVGIRAEDRIVAVDGESISGPELSNTGVYGYLRGPKGTKVALRVVRRGVAQPLSFEVTRDRIPITSIDAFYEVKPGLVYIKISRFAQTTMSEFIQAFGTLKDMPRGIILDLQGNGGGYLGTALFLAEQFLPKGSLLLYTEGAHMPRREERASGNGFFQQTPLVVLLDESSASASEIVAGAIQDWDRGTIIGRRSFGKGLVQQGFKFDDGSEMRLTVARYHTPSGRVIQTSYKMGDRQAYYQQFLDRYARGEYFNADSVHVPDSLVFKTLVKGRTVYGGGGILPDVFVPADTTFYSDFYSQILQRGLLTEFMNNYLDVHREELAAKYATFEAFDAAVPVSAVPFDALLAYLSEKKLVPKPEELTASGNIIRLQMKALIARRLFDTTGYYRVINPVEPAFRRAVEEFSN